MCIYIYIYLLNLHFSAKDIHHYCSIDEIYDTIVSDFS